jgi:diaminohydroxyphosphoribosylaminopyrimidine deaminase / 5-amino-6-(5-phosphoribosylamino)uracil reductase
MGADEDRRYMQRALELAQRGEGRVEPNPMVGCVLVRDGTIVGEGWHQKFGGAHAEIGALKAAGQLAQGATAYVTLEPCCHTGKTPPCTTALIAADVARVVAACKDPNPAVSGGGLAALAAAGVVVESGLLEDQATALIAPFAKLMTQHRPWIIAKWAMTLDGKIASHTGDSRWISGEASRAVVHQLRGRVDAILVGRGTAELDDPLLTARPRGLRTPTRVVLDSQATLAHDSRLVSTAQEAPVMVVASASAPSDRCEQLRNLGVEVRQSSAPDRDARLAELLDELGRRQMTNVLVEGGGEVLGALRDLDAIDEVHVFVAPRILGGMGASPMAGIGVERVASAMRVVDWICETYDDDVYLRGRISR